jgi:hypothetical protein
MTGWGIVIFLAPFVVGVVVLLVMLDTEVTKITRKDKL